MINDLKFVKGQEAAKQAIEIAVLRSLVLALRSVRQWQEYPRGMRPRTRINDRCHIDPRRHRPRLQRPAASPRS
jgi:hypothetical protein